jgi:ubiquinone/menaquinone biosynthesis C-methylase UbiE
MSKKERAEAKGYASFWKNLAPEIKPLPSQLALFEVKVKEILARNKNPKALVLGVTPELRDLLAKYKIETTCLDLNPMMIDAMKFLIKRKNLKEKIVKGNWFKMPFSKNYFDMIISDMPQDNLKFSDFNNFFGNVGRVLKIGGYWMTGATHFEGRKEAISLDEYVKIYRKNKKNFDNPSIKLYYLLKLSGNGKFYNKNKKIADWVRMNLEFKKLCEKGKISKQELGKIAFPVDELEQSLAVQFTWITRKEFLSLVEKQGLYLLGYLRDDFYPAGYFRQAFIFKKL